MKRVDISNYKSTVQQKKLQLLALLESSQWVLVDQSHHCDSIYCVLQVWEVQNGEQAEEERKSKGEVRPG